MTGVLMINRKSELTLKPFCTNAQVEEYRWQCNKIPLYFTLDYLKVTINCEY